MTKMTPNSIVTSKYSSSTTTDTGSNSEHTIALGQALAAELDSHDLLGRWIAHYIAELISQVETAAPTDRPQLQQKCAYEIERLWAHRTHFPSRRPPMSSFEPLYRTLERLSPDNPEWSFYNHFPEDRRPDREATQTNHVLRAARDLEATTRDVVRALIIEAAAIAEPHESNWIEAASHLEDDEAGFLSVLRRMRWKAPVDLSEDATEAATSEDDYSSADAAVQALDKMIDTCNQAKAALQDRQG
ncbi:hypothetical protein ACFYSW_25150 [Rhodococcus aetherivorans]|uniref:hypothetical protein n=1 Tax=Rhodococcus aetherivorans TaxID=191292 RepID=UPI0036899F63